MTFEAIHNYYEPLVIEYLMNTVAKESDVDQDFLKDVACLALNQLPSRYVRQDVDMAFFLTTREREKMQTKITEAVLNAVRRVRESRRQHDGA
jgi:competence protein ComFB